VPRPRPPGRPRLALVIRGRESRILIEAVDDQRDTVIDRAEHAHRAFDRVPERRARAVAKLAFGSVQHKLRARKILRGGRERGRGCAARRNDLRRVGALPGGFVGAP
jgi:hypothetical protein